MITVCHHSASLMMPIDGPRDGFFYPTLTLMIVSYNNAPILEHMHVIGKSESCFVHLLKDSKPHLTCINSLYTDFNWARGYKT